MTEPDNQAAAGRDRLRAGHADREQVILALKDAFVQDRLTRDELDLRAGRALTARTRAELDALIADIPAGQAAAGPARPPAPARSPAPARAPAPARPSLVQRRPLVWAFGGSGSCLAFAFGVVLLAANVLDPHGLGNPYHPWSDLCRVVAFFALMAGIGILTHGLGTAAEQRRARRQLPPGGQEKTIGTAATQLPLRRPGVRGRASCYSPRRRYAGGRPRTPRGGTVARTP